ncbi:hypothetical protein BDF21DRAFT_339574, partial [Thamnidium elegans]
FLVSKFEIVATGGHYNDQNNTNRLAVFLGVMIPSLIGKDSNSILFLLSIPADTSSCIRRLRNYKRIVL